MILYNKPAIINVFIVVILTARQIPASGFLRKTHPLPWIGCLLPPKENNRTQRGIPSRNGKAWWKNFHHFFPCSIAPNRGQVFGAMWEGHQKWLTVTGRSHQCNQCRCQFCHHLMRSLCTWRQRCRRRRGGNSVFDGGKEGDLPTKTKTLKAAENTDGVLRSNLCFGMPPREGHFPKTNSKRWVLRQSGC